MDVFLLNCLLIVWASLGAARRLSTRVSDQILAAALLAWGNVVVTCLLLSFCQRLGDSAWFAGVSGGLALVACLPWTRIAPPAPPGAAAVDHPEPKAGRWLVGGFLLTLVPVAWSFLQIASSYQPNNEDSLTHGLPRVMYYLGQGSLVHFAAADPRQVWLPFNYQLVQLFGLVHGQPLFCLNFFNLAAWLLGGLAIHRLCRVSGCGVNASLLAAWLALTATPVLAQAASTTPELPAGTAMLCAFLFARLWQQTRHGAFALLAGLAAGLAAGSWIGFLSLAPVLLLWAAWTWWPARRIGSAGGMALLRAWILPATLALIIGTPFLLFNLAGTETLLDSGLASALRQPRSDGALNVWSGLLPGLYHPRVFAAFNENNAGFGLTGPVFLLCAVLALARDCRTTGWLAWPGVGWILTSLALHFWLPAGPRGFVPVLLLLSPSVAAVLESIATASRLRRAAGGLTLLVVALVALWSGGIYLLTNTSRPLAPLLGSSFVPASLPPLPLLLAHRLSSQPRINLDTDGVNERLFLIMAQARNHRFTSRGGIDPDSYNLLSRSSLSRSSGARDLATRAACALVQLPGKRTAGVEFLATIGNGMEARDYFGLPPRSGEAAPAGSDQNVLLTLSRTSSPDKDPPDARLNLIGLNPGDQALLTVDLEQENGSLIRLATFTADGTIPLQLASPFRRLLIKVVEPGTGSEIGVASIPYQSRPAVAPEPVDPGLPSNPLSLFSTDLIRAAPTSFLDCEGLMPVEGPLPQWNLPYFRSARQPTVLLRFAPNPQLAGLQVSFSVRLQDRKVAEFDVLFNGTAVKHYRLEGTVAWLDETLEFLPQPGANVLEFRDAPLKHEYDLLDYLERYPDVKNYFVSMNLPLEESAREHYDKVGRTEGRTMRTMAVPPPAPGSYHFVFRKIHLEGFRAP